MTALAPSLPLPIPVDPDLPPSPKPGYRSTYQPPDPAALPDPAEWAHLSDFELALAMIDCSPLERLLAAMYRPSAKGQVPFHPVSLLLAVGLQQRARAGLAGAGPPAGRPARGRLARPPRLRRRPDPVGVRLALLLPGGRRGRRRAPLPAVRQPAPGSRPGPGRPAGARDHRQSGWVERPCRAREQGREGCACATPACREQCARASRLDPQARFIHSAGHDGARGTDVFGDRSVADRALDDRVAVAWTLTSGLYSATTDERTIFVDRVQALTATCPDLPIGEWLDDAGVGYGDGLDAVWQLGALRMIDLRADPTDRDPAACLARGYDAVGRPRCPHGYRLRATGYDSDRRRATSVCAQACRRAPPPTGPDAAAPQPVAAGPCLEPPGSVGFVVNVGRTRPAGARRLARDLPVGSDAWNARDGRRNLAASRNGHLAGLGLKRLPTHGLPQNTKQLQLADVLLTLPTRGRLLRQASTLPPA